jgi:isopentenyl diphosphate isomerase/L-lactate dehydrogenase-like FMN-dependent dehydrogenase
MFLISEPVAFKKVPPAHFGYMASSGSTDAVTLRANRQSFLKYHLRPRRMRDVSSIDTSAEPFWDQVEYTHHHCAHWRQQGL